MRKLKKTTVYRSDIGTFEMGASGGPYYRSREIEYNLNEEKVHEKEYQSNGRLYAESTWEYDEKGRLIKKDTRFIQDDTVETTLYEYAGGNDAIREQLLYDGSLYDEITYEYNSEGKLLKKERRDEDGTMLEREVYEYNEKGEVARHLSYSQENGPDKEIIYHYNEQGHCIQEEHRSSEKLDIISFTYNDAGKKIRSEVRDSEGNVTGFVDVEYNEAGLPFRYTSETSGYTESKMSNQLVYDDKGRTIDNEYYDILHGILISRETYQYNEEGRVLKEELYENNPGGQKTHFRQEYGYEYEGDQ